MLSPKILVTNVMHRRSTPAVNQFAYKVYYLWFALDDPHMLKLPLFSINRFNLFSFFSKDYGARDGRTCRQWLDEQLNHFNITPPQGQWFLLTMPRVLGYVFNPVSFWCCINEQNQLLMVIAEVHNTFGESHSYLLIHEDGRPISSQEWLESEKLFHVSPFLEVKGKYQFRFDIRAEKLGIWIDHTMPEHGKVLTTAMSGNFINYNHSNLSKLALSIPLVTVKVIALIHFQALKLWLKKVKYRRKPPPPEQGASKWP